ncbi:MAG: nitrite reductase large subunit NirB [Bacteroidota bacterium]
MKIVVIGNGMVSYKFCEKLIKKSGRLSADVVVFGDESIPAYDRVHLSEYFEQQTVDKLLMSPASWYAEQGITLRIGELVTAIDRDKKCIVTHKGHVENYDYLILATGSAAFVPRIEGMEKRGVFVYRKIEDLDQIISFGSQVRRAAVLGGGLLGLEAAKALLDMNLETQVIEFADRLMPRQLDVEGANLLKDKISALGIEVLLGKNTQKIDGNGKLDSLHFADGTSLQTDMLVISCGIVPRIELADPAGLETGPRGGFVVNEKMQTNDPSIYAIGEAASVDGMVYGLVAPGYEMADIVVEQLLGEGAVTFDGADMSTKLKLIGVDVGSFGDAIGETPDCIPISFTDRVKGTYKRINISPDGKKLLGGILVGDAADYNMLHQFFKNEVALPPDPEDLILGSRGNDSSSLGSIASLPVTSQICSCENVTKGAIEDAVRKDGIETVAEVISCTKAGTGCGACKAMVADIVNETLSSMGKVVRKVLCEHFDYTRQELFDLVKVTGIQTYDEFLDEYGDGDGCEVCKPAMASIFASVYNDLIVKQDTIQDTNDRFLANIQKGGSYSVVPRIPGGEITPDKLIVIGEVAKDYDLYTKITGGQRIDLFGARIEDLPDIWERLINAGFESGHAYGKSLRTVKSCVGSTWCRYGLHDSVSFAISVESRYKGLRAPHKLKGAVSGCRRECAEAQSKDFGIIATEVGWNLYVCGNGGANPVHAQLLAGDIDEATVISYLDRFLMFYIKTAEPLNRTSVWMSKLEGGIDYLKSVIVEDSLGIGAQLEAEMQQLIDVYKCEWTEVVNNPELRKKFTHFSNRMVGDPTIKFDQMRGQKVPANWG